MKTLIKILEMIRFSHTLFALPFALLAAVMAWAAPLPEGLATLPLAQPLSLGDGEGLSGGIAIQFRWLDLIGILVCMVGARSAAMAFNRWADRFIDAGNPRTAGRHLPSGQLSVGMVVGFTVFSALVFVGGTCLFLPNWLPLAVSIPVLGVLLGYSYAKRFTSLAHYWLGFALALAPVCAWLAVRGLVVAEVPTDLAPAVVLGLVVLFWVAGFDMIYACQDFEFDREEELNSIPVRLGVAGALRLAAICHAVMVGLLVLLGVLHFWVGPEVGFGLIYWLTVAAVGLLLVYEHSLVRADDLQRVNVAFFNVNVVVSVGLLVAGLVDLVFV